MADQSRRLVALFSTWLRSLSQTGSVSAEQQENIEVALTCLGVAFNVDAATAASDPALSIAPFELPAVIAAGEAKLQADLPTYATLSNGVHVPVPPSVKPEHRALYLQFVTGLDKQGVFTSATHGTPEWDQRVGQINSKFMEKMYGRSPEQEAEHLKKQGNAKVAEREYAEAIKLYSAAIDLTPGNPILYSNRAAAFTAMEQNPAAEKDCEKAIELDPTYAKAWSRLGVARYRLGKFQDSADAYAKALELEPDNDAWRQAQQQAQQRIGTAGAGSGNVGGAAGGFDIASLLNNPQMADMASQMASNPQMVQMAQNLMSNPAMMGQMMQSMQGMFGGAPAAPEAAGAADANAAAAPAATDAAPAASADAADAASAPAAAAAGGNDDPLASLLGPEALQRMENNPQLAAIRQNPRLMSIVEEVKTNGPMAAMPYMNDPEVMQALTAVMSSLNVGAGATGDAGSGAPPS